jgi:hypothetical protein
MTVARKATALWRVERDGPQVNGEHVTTRFASAPAGATLAAAFSVGRPMPDAEAAAATLDIAWTGSSGYTLTGQFTFDDALLTKSTIDESDLISFTIGVCPNELSEAEWRLGSPSDVGAGDFNVDRGSRVRDPFDARASSKNAVRRARDKEYCWPPTFKRLPRRRGFTEPRTAPSAPAATGRLTALSHFSRP